MSRPAPAGRGDPRPDRDGAAADRASRRERAGHDRHPGRRPAVLRLGRGPADGEWPTGRLPPAGDPRAGGHRDQPGQPRDRDRLRAQLRRPEAARRLAADARAACWRPRCWPSSSVEIGQVVLLVAIAAVVLGWRPGPGASPALFVVALLLGTLAFAGLGLLLAGALRAEATLALANGLFIAFLLLGGIVVPVADLPGPLADARRPAARRRPSPTRSASRSGRATADVGRALATLAVWGVGGGGARAADLPLGVGPARHRARPPSPRRPPAGRAAGGPASRSSTGRPGSPRSSRRRAPRGHRSPRRAGRRAARRPAARRS